jgi:hypothetical protein
MRTYLPFASLALAGCFVEEGNEYLDVTGIVKIPVEAAIIDVTVTNDEGIDETYQVGPDVRALGPVYLGLYSDVKADEFGYPHPVLGPVLDVETGGNAYPYGGTSVGRFDYGCYEMLRCRIVTGRYETFDDVLEWFAEDIGDPILNPYGDEVGSATEYRERCYELMFLTSDDEIPFIGKQPYFEQKGDYFEAEVSVLHTLFKEGVNVWGWVDRPSPRFEFDTCELAVGWQMFYYDEQYITGSSHQDLLNFPNQYITKGDWVVGEAAVLDKPDQSFEVEISYAYE